MQNSFRGLIYLRRNLGSFQSSLAVTLFLIVCAINYLGLEIDFIFILPYQSVTVLLNVHQHSLLFSLQFVDGIVCRQVFSASSSLS